MSNLIIDPSHMTDQWLSPKEAIIKAKAENDQLRNKFRLPDQETLKDLKRRMGKKMKHSELVEKVRKLSGYKVWGEDSVNSPNGYNFYRLVNDKKVCLKAAHDKGHLGGDVLT